MKERKQLRVVLLVAFFSFLAPGRCQDPSEYFETCLDFVMNSRLDLFATNLVIDDLVKAYHDRRGLTIPLLKTASSWDFTIDATCLGRLSRLENAKREGAFIDLTRFTTHLESVVAGEPESAFITIKYHLVELRSIDLYATILISNPEKIDTLVLSHNPSLRDFEPGSFSLLTSLISLNLAWNDIAPFYSHVHSQHRFFVPSSLEGLDRLERLNLSGNPLYIYFSADFFVYVSRLTHLDLSASNAVATLVPGTFNGLERLEYLNLSAYLRTADLGGSLFYGLRSLKTLDLTGIEEYDQDGFFNELTNVTELVLVDFGYSFLYKLPNDAFDFPNSLLSLDLSFRNELYFRAKSIDNLRPLHELKWLYLRYRGLETSHIVPTKFPERYSLIHIDFTWNRLTNEVFERLAFLNRTLKSLVLNRNRIKLNEEPANISLLSGLTELYLKEISDCKLNKSHFLGMNNLKVLDLSSNRIDRLTLDSFVGLDRLQTLSLADNFIQVIENGSFTPLVSLSTIDIRRNQLRNLYFFGLRYRCAIQHDGVNLYNISFIDLSQMGSGRERSFLQKTLHLRGLRRLPIYRNIRVNWRSASARPNCSVYFHVLRRYRVISFEIDQTYIDACLSEDLELSEHTFYQEKFYVIEGMVSWSLLSISPPGIDYFGATSDGFLIGLNRTGSEIILVQLNRVEKPHKFRLDVKQDELVLLSDELLLSRSKLFGIQTIWNMSDRLNITLLVSVKTSTWIFQFMAAQYVVTVDSYPLLNDVVCLLNISTRPVGTKCVQSQYLPLTGISPLGDEFVVSSSSWDYKFAYELRIRNLSRWFEDQGPACALVNSNHSDAIDDLRLAPNGLLVSQTITGEVKVWQVGAGCSLEHKRTFSGIIKGGVVFLKSLSRWGGDTLIASLEANAVNIWSVRYGKQIEKISFSRKPTQFFSLFNWGLLVVDNFVYQL